MQNDIYRNERFYFKKVSQEDGEKYLDLKYQFLIDNENWKKWNKSILSLVLRYNFYFSEILPCKQNLERKSKELLKLKKIFKKDPFESPSKDLKRLNDLEKEIEELNIVINGHAYDTFFKVCGRYQDGSTLKNWFIYELSKVIKNDHNNTDWKIFLQIIQLHPLIPRQVKTVFIKAKEDFSTKGCDLEGKFESCVSSWKDACDNKSLPYNCLSHIQRLSI